MNELDLITPSEAQTFLRASLGTIHRWILTGKLVGYRRGGRWFIERQSALDMYRKVELKDETPPDPGVPQWVKVALRKQGIM